MAGLPASCTMPAPVGQPCHRPLARLWAVLLLVLVVSPVTAPFSSCDLENLLSDSNAHHGAILHSKVLQDKPADGLARPFVPEVRHPAALEPAKARPSAPALGCGLQPFPLRV